MTELNYTEVTKGSILGRVAPKDEQTSVTLEGVLAWLMRVSDQLEQNRKELAESNKLLRELHNTNRISGRTGHG